jgi:hypothetical protein
LREHGDGRLVKFRAVPVSGWFPDHGSYAKVVPWWTFVKNASSSTGYNDALKGFLAAGNDVPGLPKTNESITACRLACSKCAACRGFTFSSKQCNSSDSTDPTDPTNRTVSCSFKTTADHFVPSSAASYGDQMKATYDLHNASAGVPHTCKERLPPNEQWRCFLANYSYAASTTPMFPLQSSLDLYSLFAIARIGPEWQQGCLATRYQFDNCSTEQVQQLVSFQADVMADIARVPKFQRAGEGGFISPCLEHQGGISTVDYDDYTIGGTTMQQALAKWWLAGADPASQHWHLPCKISIAPPHQCNPSCFAQ